MADSAHAFTTPHQTFINEWAKVEKIFLESTFDEVCGGLLGHINVQFYYLL